MGKVLSIVPILQSRKSRLRPDLGLVSMRPSMLVLPIAVQESRIHCLLVRGTVKSTDIFCKEVTTN